MVKKFFKKILPLPIWKGFSQLKAEASIYLSHRRGLDRARKYDKSTDLHLNLACGNNPKNGYLNIDFTSASDFGLDLRQPLPFAENSCKKVYCEHFLEHIEYPEEASSFLEEIHRILNQGGILTLGVPDTEQAMAAYFGNGSAQYFDIVIKRKFHPAWAMTRLEHINCHFRHSGHKFAYDFETLSLLLERCGFANIKKRSFDIHEDAPDREGLTLYVTAEKS